jgi:hypothetical protein
MRQIGSIITVKRLIGEQTLTTTPTAVVIDRGATNNRIYDALDFHFWVGAGGITFSATNFLALKLEDSDDNVTYANVTTPTIGNPLAVRSLISGAAGAPFFGQDPDANGYVRLINAAKAGADADPFSVDYIGHKQFARASIVFGGTHATGTPVSLWATLGYPNILPA